MAQQHRNRAAFRPWWRPVASFAVLTLFYALAFTYLPEVSRGRPFVVELRWGAIFAVCFIAVTTVLNLIVDWREQQRKASKSD